VRTAFGRSWLAVLAGLILVFAASAVPLLPRPEEAPTTDEAVRRAVTVLHAMAGQRRLLLVGEFHGTREIPSVVARLAERYATDGPVLVALEVDHREQGRIDAYLASDGSPSARRLLESGRFRQRADDQHAALATHDLVDLIEHVRRLRRQGRDAAVLAYDVSADAPRHDRDWRDRAMATSVRAAYAALPHGRLLMLTGNVHAMKARPAYLPPDAPRPAGTWLLDLDPFSVRLMARGGYSWVCTARCGPARADGSAAKTGPAKGPYDALVVIPVFTVARLMGAEATR
jgi:hypothetical protein